LRWEQRHFGPGGPGWRAASDHEQIHQLHLQENPMRIFQRLLSRLLRDRPQQRVRGHTRRQAHGRRWTLRRLRRIATYARRRRS